MNEDLHVDAAEYVLGTLDRTEREAFADRLRSDGDSKRAVTEWEMRLVGLEDAVEPLTPGPHVWSSIEGALPSLDNKTSRVRQHDFKVIDGAGRRTDPTTIKISRDRWRLGALASGAIAAALLVFVAGRELRPVAQDAASSVYVAAVNRGGDKPALIVRVDLKTRQVFVRPVAAETPAGKSLELWYIGDGKAPRSMGLVDKVSQTLTIPRGAQDDAATFAVSVEPPGGSITGGPTGPVVYAGQLVKE